MSFPIPHITWDSQKCLKRLKDGEPHGVTRKLNEDQFLPEFRPTCPRISIHTPHKTEDEEDGSKVQLKLLDIEETKVLQVDLANHHTLPFPLFTPTSRKCGRGPVANNLLQSNHMQKALLHRSMRHECAFLTTNQRETGATLKKLDKAWNCYVKDGKELPKPIKSLETILDKYACDEPPSESYAGGNIAIIILNGQRYLVHSLMEWDCALCLSRMTSDDISHPPIDIKQKVPLDGGPIYQITVPHNTIERDPELSPCNDQIFATRQLHTTRLWKATYDERHQIPSLIKVQEYFDSESTVRFVQLNPNIWGEFCELRPKQITISRDGYLSFRREISSKYDRCFYAIHPRIVMLTSQDSVEVLDTRCRPNSSMHSAFSFDDKDFRAIYSISSKDRISCFSPTSRENISFITTGRHLFVWDIRLGKRPLSCTPHLMDSEPFWLTSVAIGSDKEWLFLDSRDPECSSVIGYTWGSQCYTANSEETMPAVGIEIECRSRFSLCNTLDHLRSEAIGLDFAVKNRFEQQRCGVVCDKESDGTVLAWQCNAAGDIFVQQLDINKSYGFEDQTKSYRFTSWMTEWIDATVEFEETPTVSISVDQSERFNCDDVVMRELKRGFGEEELQKWKMTRPEPSSSSFTSPRSATTACHLEQYCAEDFTKNTDSRGLEYNGVWGITAETEIEEQHISEDSFSHYLKDKPMSSTPMLVEGKYYDATLRQPWLATPSQLPFRFKQRPPMKDPLISSSPLFPSQVSAMSSQKSSKKPTVWDDF